MKFKSFYQDVFKGGMDILIGLSLLKLSIHLFTNGFASYGIFRDELYYLACSHRLALGYVDQPPLSIYILAFSRLLFGESLFALRLLPAIAGALTVFLTGLIVRKLGGGKAAIIVASLAVIFSPIQLATNTIYSMNSFDILLWVLAVYVLMLIVKDGSPKLWIILGCVLGLGLLNKVGMLWFGFGLFAGLILTKQRKSFKTIWPWVCAALAFSLFLPYVIWNFSHDFAHVEFIRNASLYKYSGLKPFDFLFGQIFLQNPVSLPVWLAGLYFFFFHKEGKTFRLLGYIYLTAFLILLANGTSKPEYLSPAYPMLFAGGSVFLEKLSYRKYWRWLKFAVPILILASGIVLAPLTLPILPVKTYIRYSNFLGMKPISYEGKELTELPQYYADMFGWENMARTVAEVYHSLPEDEQSRTILFGQNYGEAGAMEYYRKTYGLPRVVSSHNNYWIWGYGSEDFETVIFIGGSKEDYADSFEQVERAAVVRCDYCMPYENNLPITIARNLKVRMSELWSAVKHYE